MKVHGAIYQRLESHVCEDMISGRCPLKDQRDDRSTDQVDKWMLTSAFCQLMTVPVFRLHK